MKRREILPLEISNTYPSISIFMPTQRKYPESRQNKINVKTLAARIKEQLSGEFDKNRADEIMSRVDTAIEEIDFEHPGSGLAVFVSDDVAKSYNLPFAVKERVVVDKTFETRELVYTYNRSNPYYVIVLDEKLIKIYSGSLQKLSPVKHPKLPLESPVAQGPDITGRAAENEDRLKNYFREADHILRELVLGEKIPFIVTGTEKEIAYYKEVTSLSELTLGTVHGSYSKCPLPELAERVWPALKAGYYKEQEKVLLEADKAEGAKRLAAGIEKVWQTAQEGRGMKLLVEAGYEYPERVYSAKEFQAGVYPAKPGENGEVLDDAVDDVIETVLAAGGEVIFFEDGRLESYNRIAMILRY